MLTRLAAIGLVLLIVVAGFAYVGGWLSPGRLTPGRFVDAFEQVNGVHPGFRRNHAKGALRRRHLRQQRHGRPALQGRRSSRRAACR